MAGGAQVEVDSGAEGGSPAEVAAVGGVDAGADSEATVDAGSDDDFAAPCVPKVRPAVETPRGSPRDAQGKQMQGWTACVFYRNTNSFATDRNSVLLA